MTSNAVKEAGLGLGLVGARPQPAPRFEPLNGIGDVLAAASVAETLTILGRFAWMTFRADAAGFLLVGEHLAALSTASGVDARQADALQLAHFQGPGLQAIKNRQPVISDELRFDGRWRSWAPQAADLGFRSVLSLALRDGDPFGAITLYSESPAKFGTDMLVPGLAFARQASQLITAALDREHVSTPADAQDWSVRHQAAS